MHRRVDNSRCLTKSQNGGPAAPVLPRWAGVLRKLLPRNWRSERPSAEPERSTAEVRYRILFENSPDAVFVVAGSRETLREFNDRLPELLGYSREQLGQMSRAQFELGIPMLSMRSSIVSVFSPKTSEFDAKYRRADGTMIDVAVTYSVVDYFGEAAYLMIARDVTTRRRAEQQLRESEAKFRTLAETIPALVAIQRDGHAVYANPAFTKLSGYSATELLRSDLLDLISPEFQLEARRSVESCLRGQCSSWRREVALRKKSGEIRWIDLTVAPILLEGQSAWLASAVDITEQRQAETELRQLNAQLFHAGRLRMLGELAAGIAHRVKHPLGNVGNLTQSLINDLDRGQPTFHEELRETLVMVLEETADADRTISEMIGFARRHEMDRRWIDLAPLLVDAARIARFDRRWAEVAIHIEADETRPNAFADRSEITQVLIDLIRNAFEAMEELPIAERRLQVELRSERAGWLRLSVRDCGCGVSEAQRLKLFQAFETTKVEGLGLGLSLCKTIIEGHGGRLWHEPAQPRGSVFHVLLPSEGRVFESSERPATSLEA
ncbi:MAG: PAS domain S-box protein [Planctomycetaceae bacterium]